MALTEEEVKEIATKAAEKVIWETIACKCGRDAYKMAHSGYAFLEGILDKKPTAVEVGQREYLQSIGRTEASCGINLSEVSKKVAAASKAAKEEDWKEAEHNALEASQITQEIFAKKLK